MADEDRSRRIRQLILVVLLGMVFVGLLYAGARTSRMLEQERREAMLKAVEEREALKEVQKTSQLLQAYKKTLSRYEEHRVSFPADRVAVYAAVEQTLTGHGVEMDKITPKGDGSGRYSVQVRFTGPYYSVLGTLAEWRTMADLMLMQSLSLSWSGDGEVSCSAVLATQLVGGKD
ncbi:MAG: hypothetical protein K9L28_09200 [Synergistales bacterium]|nr:hypothetical protein [Synergistales bacterium]